MQQVSRQNKVYLIPCCSGIQTLDLSATSVKKTERTDLVQDVGAVSLSSLQQRKQIRDEGDYTGFIFYRLSAAVQSLVFL